MLPSALRAVLSTPELLEALFLQCDIRDLLLSIQLVCRQWHAIIRTSPSVQVHMFLRSSTTLKTANRTSPSSPPRPSHTANPLLADIFGPFFAKFEHGSLLSPEFFGRMEIESLPIAYRPKPFMRKDASWRRMHVQQPPLRQLGVAIPSENYSTIYQQDITMGCLYDYVLRILTTPNQQWRIWWAHSPGLGEDSKKAPPGEFSEKCVVDLLAQVDVVLVRRSLPWPAITIRPGDRDFIGIFSHPNRLSSKSLDYAPQLHVSGRLPRREQREL